MTPVHGEIHSSCGKFLSMKEKKNINDVVKNYTGPSQLVGTRVNEML